MAIQLSLYTDTLDVTEERLERAEEQVERLQAIRRDHAHTMGRLSRAVEQEVDWVTRALLSETTRPDEWTRIAWVIRNRFEMGFRGATSYKEVVLDPYQFSAFNEGRAKRHIYMNLSAERPMGYDFHAARRVAQRVLLAPPSANPIPRVLHFYSPIAVDAPPAWSKGLAARPDLSSPRFRFYEIN